MRACGVHTYDDYRDLLERSPNEYERLRDALTINVTRFYRNAETWNLLRRDVLPALLDGAGPRCGSGARAAPRAKSRTRSPCSRPTTSTGPAGATSSPGSRSTPPTSTAPASSGPGRPRYRSEGLTEMPDDLVRAYFEAAGDERRVIDRVRRRVHVRPLDLSREPPLRTDYDLILCRNVVIYFDRAMQERLFQTFTDALVPGGYPRAGQGRDAVRPRPRPAEPRRPARAGLSAAA